MSKIAVRLDADLVIDLMLLTGVRDAQDAVELVVRDVVARGRRTDAVTGRAADDRRRAEDAPRPDR